MNKNKKSDNNKTHTNQEKLKASVLNPTVDKPTTDAQETEANKKKKDGKWQRVLVIVNILTLVAFCIVNYFLIASSEWKTKIELRSYIQMKEVSFYRFAVGKQLVINVGIINVGKTPAYKVNLELGAKVGGTGVYEIDWKLMDKYPLNLTLGSSSATETMYETNFIPTENDSLAIINTKPLWCFGTITYEDIFNNFHRTNFAVVYDTETKKFFIYDRYNNQE